MIDIVGTLNQPHLTLLFLLLGLITGASCIIVKLILKPSKKPTLVVGDFLCTVLFFFGYFSLSLYKTHGVIYAYTLLSTTLGFAISYFSIKKLLLVIVKTFKKFCLTRNKIK